MRKSFLICLLIIAACGSQSTHDNRFRDSETLRAPLSSLTLTNPDQFTFAIVGDTHVGGQDTTRFRTILNQAKAEGDSFVILLGDIVDTGERDDVLAVQTAINDTGWAGKVIPVIGNHDVFNDGWKNYRELQGQSHYVVDAGNSRFIALDTADGVVGDTQADWLKGELNKPAPKNTFLLSHYLPMIPGQRTYLRLSNEEEAIRLMKLATNRKVKAWLGGHYHSFAIQDVEGVNYVVAGGGGGRRMKPIEKFFFVQVQVNQEDIQYQLRLVD